MPAPVRCPQCGNPGKVPNEFLGKKIKCRHCGNQFQAILDTSPPRSTAPVAQPAPVVAHRPAPPIALPPRRSEPDDATVAMEFVPPPLPVPPPMPVSRVVQLPVPVPVPKPPGPDDFRIEVADEYKECPFCSEQILSTAKKCKHCGEFLMTVAQNQSPPPPPSAQNQLILVPQSNERQVGFHCPFCNTTTAPRIESKTSAAGWVFFWVLLLFLCLPLCWIGLFIKDEYKVCSACGVKLG
jgi:LITAF-like zinc ribbon domain